MMKAYTINHVSRDLDVPEWGSEFTTFDDAVRAFAKRYDPSRWVIDTERKMVIVFEVGTPENKHAGVATCVCPINRKA